MSQLQDALHACPQSNKRDEIGLKVEGIRESIGDKWDTQGAPARRAYGSERARPYRVDRLRATQLRPPSETVSCTSKPAARQKCLAFAERHYMLWRAKR
jgi:hypothetical protein